MLKPGDQIIYIPTHAKGDKNHPDCELGFVTSIPLDSKSAFCRYWSKYDSDALRTTANSEATPMDMLQLHKTKPLQVIVEMMKDLHYII